MHSINLPHTGCMRSGAIGLIFLLGLVPLLADTLPAWRLILVVAVLLTGVGTWWHYLVRRPVGLDLWPDGRVDCRLGGQTRMEVIDVRLGMVSPLFISASLVTSDGVARLLFVPACSVSARKHWELRRRLLAWRGNGDDDSLSAQSGERRGT